MPTLLAVSIRSRAVSGRTWTVPIHSVEWRGRIRPQHDPSVHPGRSRASSQKVASGGDPTTGSGGSPGATGRFHRHELNRHYIPELLSDVPQIHCVFSALW